ncbi:hypothetical protein SESBI_50837 [Sesbania bispinosa]|nr:hypothetical protein SESBI_50837 [Sesbania bispinosa]
MAIIEDTNMEPDPPDGMHQPPQSSSSFRDKLVGNQKVINPREKVDLIGRNLFRIEYEDENCLKPKCYVADSVLENLRHPWTEAVILKLLGSNPPVVVNNLDTADQVNIKSILGPQEAHQEEDCIHGDWMMVSRSKRSPQFKGKGKIQEKVQGAGISSGKKNTDGGNKFSSLSTINSEELVVRGLDIQGITFQSQPLSSSSRHIFKKKKA